MRNFSNALFHIHVTPTHNPSPRGMEFVGPQALLKRCFANAKLKSIYLNSLYKGNQTPFSMQLKKIFKKKICFNIQIISNGYFAVTN